MSNDERVKISTVITFILINRSLHKSDVKIYITLPNVRLDKFDYGVIRKYFGDIIDRLEDKSTLKFFVELPDKIITVDKKDISGYTITYRVDEEEML